jgi:hypothetical protein
MSLSLYEQHSVLPEQGINRQEVQDYRSLERGTPEYFAALRQRWEGFRMNGYPVIEDETDSEAFANSARHSGDFLAAPETIDAVLAIAEQDPELLPGSSDQAAQAGYEAVTAVDTLLRTIDTAREDLGSADMDDHTVLTTVRLMAEMGDATYSRYSGAYATVRSRGTEYLASRLNDIPEDAVTESTADGVRRTRSVRELAVRALERNTELDPENGVDFGPGFIEELERTKALILSLDINGATFTLPDQVTPNPRMISVCNEAINLLRWKYQQVFPGKRAHVVPNTGMGANYARGVIETAGPMVPDAVFAESGGVRLIRDGDATRSELTMEHAGLYRIAIEHIEERLRGAVANQGDMVTAPKDSMTSLMVRNPHTQEVLLKTHDGEELSEQLIAMQVEQWKAELLETTGGDPQLRAQLEGVLGQIIVNYNSAVGFVDIHDRRVHKFTALEQYIRELGPVDTIEGEDIPVGIDPEDVTVVHVGDSSVDAPPPGEAESMYIVPLGNRKESMMRKLEGHERTVEAKNEAIVGVVTTVVGMINALKTVEARRRAARAAA